MRSLFRTVLTAALLITFFVAKARDYYVSTDGSDEQGDGSMSKPWKSISYACTKVPSLQGHVIRIAAGTYIEPKILLPPGISLYGAGPDKTTIAANPAEFYHPDNPGFSQDRFLLQLKSPKMTMSNQSIRNLRIDGADKQLHGGIYIENRSQVAIQNITVENVNFCGIWLLQAANVQLQGFLLRNCAWGSSGWCSGALQITNSQHVEVSDFTIDENKGYGIKNLGHTENTPLRDIKIHDGRITVEPRGAWNNGQAPNITIEFWASAFPETEIYNCYVDNHMSFVTYSTTEDASPLRIHHNIFDLAGPRARGNGYSIELAISNAEVNHNWFNGGSRAIANWGDRTPRNWQVHHNTFYGLANEYPTAVIYGYKGGISDFAFYNNTVEMTGRSEISVLELNNGGSGQNVAIRNNLIINNGQDHGPKNKLYRLENGANITGLIVESNFTQNLAMGDGEGTFRDNQTGDPAITKSGPRPTPYYIPSPGSPLIDAGQNVGLPFKGEAPDIGAFEY